MTVMLTINGRRVAVPDGTTILEAARQAREAIELPLGELVPGDVVKLAAGDMIPGDVRLVSAKDLFIVQGALTGESFPVEKTSEPPRRYLSS